MAPLTVSLEALDFAAIVRPGKMVCWGQACGEPTALTSRLMEQRAQIGGVSAFVGIGLGEAVDPVHADHVRFTSFCGTGTNRKLAAVGALDILPVHYSDLPNTLAGQVDVLLLQLAEHPDDGRLSLSCTSDYVEGLTKAARIVVAEINRQAPFTGALVDADDVDIAIRTDRPVLTLARGTPSAVDQAVAANVASLVEDGATLQLGLGALPDCIADLLVDRRDLGLHSGLIGDGAMRLIQSGAITNAAKPVDRGLSVTGTLLGSKDLLDFAHLNPTIEVRPIAKTHSLSKLAALPRFTAINSAIEVDLSGQANTEIAGGRYVGAIGGALDFLRGARASHGGVPILALPSTAEVRGQVSSRIVARLSGPATIGRADASIIVTEYGIADLRGLSLSERLKKMVAIAHPDFRDSFRKTANL
ncbi:acetyl-CoA hydrolase/transferase family protein [Bosea sp. SSUT16]|jgi:acetyl-CoA hydrolase|uniref:Acetyl-CoA hydrolase/transferase family protein n=1 Tax=Bosea spartocytisi TaxID=2773451 RepID=A0A927EBA3_9HYPH|nr:acetyl-CoA hydrolase/transferase family protein [Bosea spartocytisi]MBD3848148.1 acetyl-CoA hydrolase/transferase family protein [Bosea spartocytisi]MCT4473998.1 acetyl-CoA hydrolase/transferase family protein [Bosea spartocytisi]